MGIRQIGVVISMAERTPEHNAKIGASNKANGVGSSPTKVCPRCGEEKPRSEFGVRNNGTGIYSSSYCFPCEKEYDNAQAKRWAKANPEKVRESNRKGRLTRHGITDQGYNALLESQNGGCAICGITALDGRRKNFDIDHDHSCCPGHYSCGECIRGLLCNHCNVMLGRAHEDPLILEAGIRYLLKYQSSIAAA